MSDTTVRGTVRIRTFPSQPVILSLQQRPQYVASEAPPPYQECLVRTEQPPCTCQPITTPPHQSRRTASSTTCCTCIKRPSILAKIFSRQRSEPCTEIPGRCFYEAQSLPPSLSAEKSRAKICASQANVSTSTVDVSQP